MVEDLPTNEGEEQTNIELSNIREISTKRKYWFVRTYGGKLFDWFYQTGRVGIAGNIVPLDLIKSAIHDDVTFKSLRSFVENNVLDLKAGGATMLAKQLVNFYHKVDVDDIVLMPSENSDYIAFGRVDSDLIENKKIKDTFTHNDRTEEFPQRYRNVEWLKIMSKRDVVGDLRNLFSTQLGLTNANKYSDFIEGNISTFFQKDEYYYSSMFVDLNDDEELNAFELYRYLEAVTKLYKHYCAANNIEENEELYLKIKIQSQGNNIWKWLKRAGGVGVAGIIGMSIVGSDPSLTINGEKGFEASIKGNVFKNVVEAYKEVKMINQEADAKAIENENKQIDLLDKKRRLGLLTQEEIEKYQIQLVDSAKALQLKSIESKEVDYKDVKQD